MNDTALKTPDPGCVRIGVLAAIPALLGKHADKPVEQILSKVDIGFESFRDPDNSISFVKTGQLLNQYDGPLKQLSRATGASCVIYLDEVPIAHAGFGDEKKAGFDASSLRISSKTLAEIYQAGNAVNLSLSLAGKRHIAACSAITSYNGKKNRHPVHGDSGKPGDRSTAGRGFPGP